jgi:hypothetical protein
MEMIDLNKICIVLRTTKCKVHQENPEATVDGDSIKLTTCCNDFQDKLEEDIDSEVSKQLDSAIDNAIDLGN